MDWRKFVGAAVQAQYGTSVPGLHFRWEMNGSAFDMAVWDEDLFGTAFEIGAWRERAEAIGRKEIAHSVQAICELVRGVASNHASASKIAARNAKVDRASRIIAETVPPEDRLVIGSEATIRGISTVELAEQILERASEYGKIAGIVDALESHVSDLVAVTEFANLAAIRSRVQTARGEISALNRETISDWLDAFTDDLLTEIGSEA